MSIHKNGFEILTNVISSQEIEAIKKEVDKYSDKQPKFGIRHADKKFQTIKALCSSNNLITTAEAILKGKVNLVRVIFFDKTPQHNWLVSWHQDKTISVNKKITVPHWKAWSIKDGTHHVQPSIDVLNKMITFRIHLDDADENNGCLKVIPQSHQYGILSQNKVEQITQREEPFTCSVNAGDILVMFPHLLHSSSKANNPEHRRIVHIEFSTYPLPQGLSWV